MTELHEYLANLTLGRPPNQRAGQWYFNLLHVVRPDLAERVRGTALDPFHDDARLAAFARWLVRHWDDPRPIPTRASYRERHRYGDATA